MFESIVNWILLGGLVSFVLFKGFDFIMNSHEREERKILESQPESTQVTLETFLKQLVWGEIKWSTMSIGSFGRKYRYVDSSKTFEMNKLVYETYEMVQFMIEGDVHYRVYYDKKTGEIDEKVVIKNSPFLQYINLAQTITKKHIATFEPKVSKIEERIQLPQVIENKIKEIKKLENSLVNEQIILTTEEKHLIKNNLPKRIQQLTKSYLELEPEKQKENEPAMLESLDLIQNKLLAIQDSSKKNKELAFERERKTIEVQYK